MDRKREIENAFTNEVTEIINGIPHRVEFITRARRYGTMEVQFENDVVENKYATNNLSSEKYECCQCIRVAV